MMKKILFYLRIEGNFFLKYIIICVIYWGEAVSMRKLKKVFAVMVLLVILCGSWQE